MRNRLIVLTLAGALLPFVPAHAGWEEGVAAFKSGNYAQAVREFEALVAANPEQAAVQMMLGRALLKSDRASQAIPALRKAYDLNPNDVATQIFLGQAYLDGGRPAEAVQLLSRVNASSLPASQQQAFSAIYSEALTKSGQTDRAASELKKLAAAKPGDADIQYQYGAMEFNAGNIAPAAAAFEKAHRIAPGDAKYARAYVNALIRLGRESNDNSAYTRALEAARSLAGAAATYENLLLLGEVQLGAKQYDAAAATFGQASAKNGGDWLPHFYAGQAGTAAGRYGDAESALRRALDRAGQSADKSRIWRQLGFVYEKQKKFAEAKSAYANGGDSAAVARITENEEINKHNLKADEEAAKLAEIERQRRILQEQLQQQSPPPRR